MEDSRLSVGNYQTLEDEGKSGYFSAQKKDVIYPFRRKFLKGAKCYHMVGPQQREGPDCFRTAWPSTLYFV